MSEMTTRSDVTKTHPNFLNRQIEHINLLVDCSGSMSTSFGNSGTRLDGAKRGVDQIVRSSSKKRTNFSLTLFDDSAQTVMPRTDKFIKLIMLEYRLGGGTDMYRGLLESYRQDPQRIIVLSDGHTYGVEQIKALVQSHPGIKIDTVSIGEANDEFMKWLADATGGTFYRAESPELLEQHYNKLETSKYLLTHQQS